MTLAHNIQFAQIDIITVAGDTIDLTFQVDINGLFDLTDKLIECKVRRKDGLIVKSWTSAGSPATISGAIGAYNIFDDGWDQVGFFDYDVQVTDYESTYTIQKGTWENKKQIT